MNERLDDPFAVRRIRRLAESDPDRPRDAGAQAWFADGHPDDGHAAAPGRPLEPPGPDDAGASDAAGYAATGEDDGDDGGDDLDLLEPSWTPPRRLGRLTVLLVAGILIAAGFGAGAVVQKQHDKGLAGSGTGAAALARAFRGAGGGGAFPGAAGVTGAGAGAAAGSGAGTGAGTGATTAQGIPVAVGTVVSASGSTLTVKNFAGTQVVVHVPAGTPVTVPGLGGLRAGLTVSVVGTKAADGSVTATSVVARSAG